MYVCICIYVCVYMCVCVLFIVLCVYIYAIVALLLSLNLYYTGLDNSFIQRGDGTYNNDLYKKKM